jgi:hypothetical protein
MSRRHSIIRYVGAAFIGAIAGLFTSLALLTLVVFVCTAAVHDPGWQGPANAFIGFLVAVIVGPLIGGVVGVELVLRKDRRKASLPGEPPA